MRLAVCVVLSGWLVCPSFGEWARESEVNGVAIYSTLPGETDLLRSQADAGSVEITLPVISGKFLRFKLERSDFFPTSVNSEIRMMEGASLEDPSARVTIVAGPESFFAQIMEREGITYIDPAGAADGRDLFKVYRSNGNELPGFSCLTEPAPTPERLDQRLSRQSVQRVRRTFRLAAAATGEFTQFFASKEEATVSMVTALSRASGIFEREIGVRLQLIDGFEAMIFEDPEADPYSTNEPGYDLLKEAQDAFDRTVGTANYDLGIVLTRGMYGLAYIRSVCDPERKGSSCIGLPEPVGDAFHVNLVTHELAHQFGANHTFNSPTGFCFERRNPWTAFEPGTGSTIMSYSSLPCEGDSFQERNDEYFHFESLREMTEFLNSPALDCGTSEPLDNQPPTINAGREYTIPMRTPFALTATGWDPDGDTVTYTWEQSDLGPAQTLGEPDNGHSPLFRSYPPTTSPTRIFPAMEYVLSGESPSFEQLPATNRLLSFVVTARDGRNDGAFASSGTILTVLDTAGPFRVSSHSEPKTLTGTTIVEWDVAGTREHPIHLEEVRITLSVDGGRSFPYVLAARTPNDGSEEVTLPPLNSTRARIKVEAVGNIFFNLSQADLTLTSDLVWITSLQRNEQELEISWSAKPDRIYQVEIAAEPYSVEWDLFKTVEARSNTGTVLIPIVEGNRFIRVVEQ